MKTTQQSIDINGPVNTVFAALADPVNQMKFDGDMMQSCEKISDGAIGKGTRFRGKFKGMGTVEYRYSGYEENKLIEHDVRMLFGNMRHRFQFEPTTQGTRLTQTINLDANFIGNLLWSLMLKKNMDKRLSTLNSLLKNYSEKKT